MAVFSYTKNTIARYWNDFPSLNELFENMHTVEEWVLEDNHIDVEERIHTWVNSLTEEKIKELPYKVEPLLIVMFFLHTRNAMFLYKKLIEQEPALDRSLQFTAKDMLNKPETKAIGTVFWDRFRYLFIDKSLSEFLSTDQLTTIKESIQHVNDQYGGIE